MNRRIKTICVPLFSLCFALLCGCGAGWEPSSASAGGGGSGASSGVQPGQSASGEAGAASGAESGGAGGASSQGAFPEQDGRITLTDEVEQVEIDWVSGGVTVATYGESAVAFQEESGRTLTEDLRMTYWVERKTLHIDFCRNERQALNGLEKQLTVWLPETLTLRELDIESVSAGISVHGGKAAELKLESASGGIQVTDGRVSDSGELESVSGEITAAFTDPLRALEVDTVSGAVEITAPELVSFQAETASGSVALSSGSGLRELKIETVSGPVTLTLPRNAGFTLRLDGGSGGFASDLPRQENKDGTVSRFGDGSGDYSIDTVSGRVTIQGAD